MTESAKGEGFKTRECMGDRTLKDSRGRTLSWPRGGDKE